MGIKEKLMEAKIQVDKNDLVTEVIIVPFSWKKHMQELIDLGSLSGTKLIIWGAYIAFGAVDEPVAGSFLMSKESAVWGKIGKE